MLINRRRFVRATAARWRVPSAGVSSAGRGVGTAAGNRPPGGGHCRPRVRTIDMHHVFVGDVLPLMKDRKKRTRAGQPGPKRDGD
jgi:hypothetical protein